MKNPVMNRVGAIFIHVTDMNRAIHFYSNLFGLPIHETAHEGTIYDLPVSGGSQIILDSNKSHLPNEGEKARLFFDTNNLQQSYHHVRDLGAEIYSEIEEHGDISFFTFRDTEGNLMMICEDKRRQ
ncbi:VOC family protein [Bacillus timonensis]|nr:VOC family protein [Bacillus timonensis]